MSKIQPRQSSTFAIRTSHYTTKNCKRACLSATAFLPTLKTNFSETAELRLSGFMIVKY